MESCDYIKLVKEELQSVITYDHSEGFILQLVAQIYRLEKEGAGEKSMKVTLSYSTML